MRLHENFSFEDQKSTRRVIFLFGQFPGDMEVKWFIQKFYALSIVSVSWRSELEVTNGILLGAQAADRLPREKYSTIWGERSKIQ